MSSLMDNPSHASAPAGLAGYFYQVDVSIYVALDLMLAQKRVDQITLEPASQEDLEADLRDETKVSATTRLTVENYRLVLQAKLRNNEPWSIDDLATLVSRDDDGPHKTANGNQRRESPAKMLNRDTGLRYLLVTSAAVKGTARELSVRRLGDWPTGLPATLKAKAPTAAGRIAVLDQLDEEKLEALIRELLLVTCKVPRANLQACIDDLRRIVLNKMRHGPSGWTRAELEVTIGKHEGYLASAPEINAFVKPTNWNTLIAALETRNAVIITGASGTGKTMAAEVLLDRLKTGVDGGFKIVRVIHGPQQVWSWNEPGPVVFMIEDPWGKFRFHPEQRPWNAELERMLTGARKDCRFIVTTRSDVLAENDAKRLASEWFVRLETQHYGTNERQRLFENRLRALPEATQRTAHEGRGLALERLESPYEIQKFFDGLRAGPKGDEAGSEFVRRCIKQAHKDAIETTVLEQVRDRDDELAAIALWGFLKARPALSWSIIPHIAQALGDKEREVEDKIEPFILFMAAGRNLRQPNSAISYYHPRVEAGLEQVITAKPSGARRLLGDLVDVLLSLDAGVDADWGQESAANLIQGAKSDKVDVRVSSDAIARLDTYLRRRLATPGDRLNEDIRLAADVGSLDNQPAELARWLSVRSKEFGFLESWREEPLAEARRAAMCADPEVAALAARFVREVLPRSSGSSFPEDFAVRLACVAGSLTVAFRDAALAMVCDGYNWNAEAVARGAIADFDGFEEVLDAAIAEGRKHRAANDDALWLEIRNGEHCEGYADHLADQFQDEGDTANTFISLYVRTARGRAGWPGLLGHRHLDGLIWAWIDLLRDERVSPLAGEMESLADACRGHRWESAFWDLAGERWTSTLAERLELLLRESGLAGPTRRSVVQAMAHDAPALGHRILEEMVVAGDLAGVLRWMADLRALMIDHGIKDGVVAFSADATTKLGPFKTLASLVLNGEIAALEPEDVSRLTGVDAAGEPDLQLAKARLLSASGQSVRPLIGALLDCSGVEADDIERAAAALALAIGEGAWNIVDTALTHKFADVRHDALHALAARETTPLPSVFLDMARDKGSRVRQALLDILEARPHHGHQGALLVMIEDLWTESQTYHGEETGYPIAERAADLLTVQGPLSKAAVEAVLKTAINTNDRFLRVKLMVAAGKQGGDHGLDRLLQLALETGRTTVHEAAADALFRAGGMGATRAARFSQDQLLRRGPSIATNMALAVGAAADLEPAVTLANAIAVHSDRAVFLIPLLAGALHRADDDLADHILALLSEPLKLAIQKMVESDAKVPRALLEDMGDFRVRDAVYRRLSGWFEPVSGGRDGALSTRTT